MDGLERQYENLVERVRCDPLSEAAGASIVDEIAAAYRRVSAEREGNRGAARSR
jgi:hypothetical protein